MKINSYTELEAEEKRLQAELDRRGEAVAGKYELLKQSLTKENVASSVLSGVFGGGRNAILNTILKFSGSKAGGAIVGTVLPLLFKKAVAAFADRGEKQEAETGKKQNVLHKLAAYLRDM